MKEYDILVIGSGSGSIIVEQALAHDFKIAQVDKGPLGGTCLNVGCIPSKMLIFPADRITDIEQAAKLGIQAEIKSIDFEGMIKRTRRYVEEERAQIKNSIDHIPQLDFYEGTGSFIDNYTMEVGGEKVRAKKVYIASGAGPFIPPLKGIAKANYLTNESLLDLDRKPASLIIIGGGYIAVEYAHFFAAMGTRVTILQRANRLVKNEEPEISELLETEMKKRLDVETNMEAEEIVRTRHGFKIFAQDKINNQKKEFTAEKVFIASGRQSNADSLKVDKTGVRTDENGYIQVNE